MQLNDGTSIGGYGPINVILGKNGSGKSYLLRAMDATLSGRDACVRYITPERGGELVYDGGVETSRSQDPEWLSIARRRNRFEQFRQSSVAEFRNLEILVLRSIESDRKIRASSFTFESELTRINQVLDRVKLTRSTSAGFDISRRADQRPAQASDLSSGESELISLAIEILYFSYLCKQGQYEDKNNWLLLDEPDVHLHPDLQHRLMELLVDSMKDVNGKVAIATHSTTILSSLCALNADIRIAFKQVDTQQRQDSRQLQFRQVDDALQGILPVFGAHPLSNVFNEKPPLIVEGEDDERIWQTAVRHSQGQVSVYPCVAGDIQSMKNYERAAGDLMNSVYDNARALSLRDRDDEPYEINDIGPVTRCRLACRSAENLIVTDDVLDELDSTWDELQTRLEEWIQNNCGHAQYEDAVAFQDSGWDRKGFRLKNLRNVIIERTGSTTPWEVAVGRAIARVPKGRFESGHCIAEYLGLKLVGELGLMTE